MLIVAKLPTKDDKRRVTRSCQRRCHYDELKAAEARESKANTGGRRVRAEGRSSFKGASNEGLPSGARQRRLADTGVTRPCRRTLLLPDSSISVSGAVDVLRPDMKAGTQALLINFACSPRTRAEEKE